MTAHLDDHSTDRLQQALRTAELEIARRTGMKYQIGLPEIKLGIIPGAIVFTWIGVGLGEVFDLAGEMARRADPLRRIGAEVYGPAAAPIARIRRRHRTAKLYVRAGSGTSRLTGDSGLVHNGA